MLFSKVASSLLLAFTAYAVSIKARDVQLADDIYAIDAAVNALTENVNDYNSGSFPSGLVDGIPILLDVVNIHLVNRKGYADANLSPTLDSQDSITVVKSVTNSVAVDIPKSVDALKAKKSLFVAAGLTQIVIASLKLLKNDHDTFSAAVVAKLTADAETTAQGLAGVKIIDDALADGIAYFSSR
ncbi:putative cell wall galactomanno protein [Venturia nashicola]|uniref:Putative cell wall galactomanno protein n=1 Tax=Venturia nashicola TaxID=86259 RepID=A0A4Z1NH48_9PEZI|nr:putative cell wall galactomanno protein [Venturia nashicola]TLD21033.1 putative cell wall galactomanno protein [Venturia nashicola]